MINNMMQMQISPLCDKHSGFVFRNQSWRGKGSLHGQCASGRRRTGPHKTSLAWSRYDHPEMSRLQVIGCVLIHWFFFSSSLTRYAFLTLFVQMRLWLSFQVWLLALQQPPSTKSVPPAWSPSWWQLRVWCVDTRYSLGFWYSVPLLPHTWCLHSDPVESHAF